MKNNGLPLQRRTKRRTKAEIQQIVEDYHRSGLSQREFAEQQELSLSSLQWWVRRAKRRSPGEAIPQWLEVSLPVKRAKAIRAAVSYQLAIAGGVLSVPSGFDPEELKELLNIVGERP